MRLQRTLLTAFMLCLFTICACAKDEPSVSNNVVSNEVETSEAIPRRESVVRIEPDPDPSGIISFYSADSWSEDEPMLMVIDTDGSGLHELSSVRSSQFSWISEIEWKPDASAFAIIAERGSAALHQLLFR